MLDISSTPNKRWRTVCFNSGKTKKSENKKRDMTPPKKPKEV